MMSSYDAVAALGRELAESRMTSTCTIRRRSGYTVVDEMHVPSWTDVATVACRLGGNRMGSGARKVSVGSTDVELATRILSLPADTTGLKDDDLAEITGGENAGAVFRIVEATWQDQSTARRVQVVEVQRPEEWS